MLYNTKKTKLVKHIAYLSENPFNNFNFNISKHRKLNNCIHMVTQISKKEMDTFTYNMPCKLKFFLVSKKIIESYLNSKLVSNLSHFKIRELILHKIRSGITSMYSVISQINF